MCIFGASNRNRTGTPAMNEAADFKSAVSTYFTIEAVKQSKPDCQTKKPRAWPGREDFQKNNSIHAVSKSGGATQSRTGLTGFAIRGITALLSRHVFNLALKLKREARLPFLKNWSGKRVSNSRPQPWQGCALPTELFPRERQIIAAKIQCFTTFALPAAFSWVLAATTTFIEAISSSVKATGMRSSAACST